VEDTGNVFSFQLFVIMLKTPVRFVFVCMIESLTFEILNLIDEYNVKLLLRHNITVIKEISLSVLNR